MFCIHLVFVYTLCNCVAVNALYVFCVFLYDLCVFAHTLCVHALCVFLYALCDRGCFVSVFVRVCFEFCVCFVCE